jgi:hypothetical protein
VPLYNSVLDNTKLGWPDASVITQKEECLTLKDVETRSSKICGHFDLLPVMIEINLWAEKYFPLPADKKALMKEAKKDKAAFIKSMTRELER